jgi:hypothetical protein
VPKQCRTFERLFLSFCHAFYSYSSLAYSSLAFLEIDAHRASCRGGCKLTSSNPCTRGREFVAGVFWSQRACRTFCQPCRNLVELSAAAAIFRHGLPKMMSRSMDMSNFCRYKPCTRMYVYAVVSMDMVRANPTHVQCSNAHHNTFSLGRHSEVLKMSDYRSITECHNNGG